MSGQQLKRQNAIQPYKPDPKKEEEQRAKELEELLKLRDPKQLIRTNNMSVNERIGLKPKININGKPQTKGGSRKQKKKAKKAKKTRKSKK